jgi:signal transduction histidine kinase
MLHAKKNKRLGLLGMSERLDMVGGKFAIRSAPGRGTTMTAEIPLTTRSSNGRNGSAVSLVKTLL